MKTNSFIIALFASIAIIATSCVNDNTKAAGAHDYIDGDGHKHPKMVDDTSDIKKVNKYQNELGQALDKNGNFITGCPAHKEMIGVEGDKCSKCGYMTMIPITWSLQGVDTVRVTSIPDYNPPVAKVKK